MTKKTRTARTKRKTATDIVKGGAAAALVTLSTVSVVKAVAATATLPVIARIVRAIEITINTSLDFGTIALTEDVAGLATIDPATSNMRFDGKGGINLAGGFPTAGRVRIKGGAGMPVHVSLDENNLRLTNGTTYLTIQNFNLNTANGGPDATVTPSGPANTAVLTIGASMKTRPQQLTGTYVGSNTIFANYQ